jgi:hypothetical protein
MNRRPASGADPVLMVDSNAALTAPPSSRRFQSVGWWITQIHQRHRVDQHPQFPQTNPMDGAGDALGTVAVKETHGIAACETRSHEHNITRNVMR